MSFIMNNIDSRSFTKEQTNKETSKTNASDHDSGPQTDSNQQQEQPHKHHTSYHHHHHNNSAPSSGIIHRIRLSLSSGSSASAASLSSSSSSSISSLSSSSSSSQLTHLTPSNATNDTASLDISTAVSVAQAEYDTAVSQLKSYQSASQRLRDHIQEYITHLIAMTEHAHAAANDYAYILENDPNSPYAKLAHQTRIQHHLLASERQQSIIHNLSLGCINSLESELNDCNALNHRLTERMNKQTEVLYYRQKLEKLRNNRDPLYMIGDSIATHEKEKYQRNLDKLAKHEKEYLNYQEELLIEIQQIYNKRTQIMGQGLQSFIRHERELCSLYSDLLREIQDVNIDEANQILTDRRYSVGSLIHDGHQYQKQPADRSHEDMERINAETAAYLQHANPYETNEALLAAVQKKEDKDGAEEENIKEKTDYSQRDGEPSLSYISPMLITDRQREVEKRERKRQLHNKPHLHDNDSCV